MADITVKDIAGLATEKTAWKMLYDLSGIQSSDFLDGISPKSVLVDEDGGFSFSKSLLDHKEAQAFYAPERIADKNDESAYVWTLGALAFYAIMGIDVLEGKGGKTQTADTELPVIGSAHASRNLSSLIYKCLSFDPSARPKLSIIHSTAEKALKEPSEAPKRPKTASGKTYSTSLVSFWPEEMRTVIVLLFAFFTSISAVGQTQISISNELGNLVRYCSDMRTASTRQHAVSNLKRDTKWTLMDEIESYHQGECKGNVRVSKFGVNQIGNSQLKTKGGVTNAGSRFRDGTNPKYNYSFYEKAIAKGATVSYLLNGREGTQVFAVIPYSKDAKFSAWIDKGGKGVTTMWKDNVCYLQVKKGLRRNDKFSLSIRNESGNNTSFVIINYNSRDHE